MKIIGERHEEVFQLAHDDLSLTFVSFYFNDEFVQRLIPFLQTRKSLNKLVFRNSYINGSVKYSLLRGISLISSLDEIELIDCELNDHYCSIFVSSLIKEGNIPQTLNLSDNELTHESMKDIITLLMTKKIRHLILNSNFGIGDQGLEILLKYAHSLESLLINNIGISHLGLQRIARFIKKHPTHLKQLGISDTATYLSEESLWNIIEYGNLTFLDLTNCRLKTCDLRHIEHMNKFIPFIDFGWNNYTDITPICDMIQKGNLHHLCIPGMPIKSTAIYAIEKVLNNPTCIVKSIVFDFILLKDDDFLKLVPGVKLHQELEVLDIRSNPQLTNHCIRPLLNAIKGHSGLLRINMDYTSMTISDRNAICKQLKVNQSLTSNIFISIMSSKLFPRLSSRSYIQHLPVELIYRLLQCFITL